MTTQPHADDVRVIPAWELCDRLARSMRLVKGMTQTDVAELMGVRRETISRWMNGLNKPSQSALMIWADMTGVDRDWLIFGHVDELRACRDSNPKPSDLVSRASGGAWARGLPGLVSADNLTLSVNRRAGHHPYMSSVVGL